MAFLWPAALWSLLLLPLLALVYRWLLRRRRQATLPLAHLPLARQALAQTRPWRRHLPPLLMALGLAALGIAAARPTARLALPAAQRTLLLVMDVSGSMRAEDVKPTRLAASQKAAKAFVAALPRDVRVGVISFAGTAAVVQAPTGSRDDVNDAIDRFQLQRGTATGSGILLALATLFPDDGIEIQPLTGQRPLTHDLREPDKPRRATAPVPPGSYNAAAIIMLTDGQRTVGPDPIEAAQRAADHGVRVYTVGIGTPQGDVIGIEGWSMRVRLDEDTLKHIARTTHGEYFYAGTAQDLMRVYESLSARLVMERREVEVSALFAALGALLVLAAAGLSLWWFARVL